MCSTNSSAVWASMPYCASTSPGKSRWLLVTMTCVAAANRSRKHVPIVGIGQLKGFDEVLVSDDEAVRNRFAHQAPCSRETLDQFGLLLKDGAFHLIEDLVRPPSLKQAGLGETNEQIALRCGVQNVSVEHRRERHRLTLC